MVSWSLAFGLSPVSEYKTNLPSGLILLGTVAIDTKDKGAFPNRLLRYHLGATYGCLPLFTSCQLQPDTSHS